MAEALVEAAIVQMAAAEAADDADDAKAAADETEMETDEKIVKWEIICDGKPAAAKVAAVAAGVVVVVVPAVDAVRRARAMSANVADSNVNGWVTDVHLYSEMDADVAD